MTQSRRVFIKNSTNVTVIWSLSAPLLGVFPLSVHAQADYPSRPIKIVVGFPAGGGTDVFARALAQALAPLLGQSVVVDNKAGVGGVIASTSMLQSPADGYTLLMGSTSTQAIAPQLYAKRPYVAAGQVPLMFDSIASAGAHIRAGKVKALRHCPVCLPLQSLAAHLTDSTPRAG